MEKNERILSLVDDLKDYRETLKQAEMDLEKSIVWIEKVKGWISKAEKEIELLKGIKALSQKDIDESDPKFRDNSGAFDENR